MLEVLNHLSSVLNLKTLTSFVAAVAFALLLISNSKGYAFVAQQQEPQQQEQRPEIEVDEPPPLPKPVAPAAPVSQPKTKSTAPTATASHKPKKPLSEDEDPSKIGKRNINTGLVAKVSGNPDKDIALGRQLAYEVDRQSKFIDDPVIGEYINRVGQNIALHSDTKAPLTVKVIDADEVNAFALPGGFLYVNKGLILTADNEAELAGVIAHEIAHVAARHAAENQAKGNIAQIGAIVGSIFLGGIPGLIFQNTASLGLLLSFTKFSRANEEEADKLGVQYMYAAGYDPNAMSTMFEKLAAKEKKKPGTLSKLFADHPQSVDRLQASRELVARFPERDEYVMSTSEFQAIKGRLLRLTNARSALLAASGGSRDGTGRPTLKRKDPNDPDASDSTPDNDTAEAPPRLKRNPNAGSEPSDSNDSGAPVKPEGSEGGDGTQAETAQPAKSSSPEEKDAPPKLKRRTDPDPGANP